MTSMYWEEPLKRKRPSIHAICTGGGADLVEMLFRPPGASVYLSGASFPYSSHELEEILGFTPKSACCPETAADLACVAYMKAFGNAQENAIGLGLTATVATSRPHRGGERVHACVVSRRSVLSVSMEFGPELKVGPNLTMEPVPGPRIGLDARRIDSMDCSRIGMKLILCCIQDVEQEDDKIRFFDRDVSIISADEFVLSRLLDHSVFMSDERRMSLDDYTPEALFPGSFNPPHAGHFGLAKEIERSFGKEVAFQISLDPPPDHKSPPTLCNVLERIHLLRGRACLVTKGDPLFIDKARKFPGVAFAIGSDALVRLLDPVWGPPIEPMLAEFERLNTKFYVAGRLSTDGVFLRPEDVSIPPKYRSMFITVPGRWDVSSSHIRFTKEESHED